MNICAFCNEPIKNKEDYEESVTQECCFHIDCLTTAYNSLDCMDADDDAEIIKQIVLEMNEKGYSFEVDEDDC